MYDFLYKTFDYRTSTFSIAILDHVGHPFSLSDKTSPAGAEFPNSAESPLIRPQDDTATRTQRCVSRETTGWNSTLIKGLQYMLYEV